MKLWWQFYNTVLRVVFRHPIIATTLIPLLPDGRIVMVRRRDTGQCALPGGIVNWGEDLATSARRELLEETGLALIRVRRLVGVYSSLERDPRFHCITVTLEIEVDGEVGSRDILELHEAKPFARDALPLCNLSHDHDRQLRDYFAGLTTVA